MSIQLFIFFYAYLVFLILWGAFSIVALYHMFKFGFKNFATYISILVYLVISAYILGVSFFYILQIDWNISIFDINNSSSVISAWK